MPYFLQSIFYHWDYQKLQYCLFGAAVLSDVWWAAIKYFRELIAWALLISCWYSLWVQLTLLSVFQQSNDKVKLILIELFKIDCVTGEGVNIGTKCCRWSMCTLLTVNAGSLV